MANKQRAGINLALMWRQLSLLILDAALLILCAGLALAIRYEFNFTDPAFAIMTQHVVKMLPLTLPCALLIFNLLDLYTSIWTFVSEQELVRVAIACSLVSVEWWFFHAWRDLRSGYGRACSH